MTRLASDLAHRTLFNRASSPKCKLMRNAVRPFFGMVTDHNQRYAAS